MSSGSKRKRFVASASQNLLHPGEWRNKRSRSGSPSASGAATPRTGCSNTPALSNHSSRSPSPTGRPGSLNDPVDTRMPPHDATLPDSRAKIGVPTSKGSAWTGLEQALRALRVTTTICPSLSTAVDELVSCLNLFEVAAKKHKDYHDLTTGLEDIVSQLARHLNGTTSKAIIDTITSIADAIRKEIASIDVQQSHNLPRRMLGASSTEDDLIRRYRRIEQLFRQLQGEAGMSTWNTVDELRVEQHLKDLRPAKLARFNSELSTEINRRRCTHGTRTKILEDSATWSEDPDLAKVYWMNGMAGTGKTTIAYSLCERLEAVKQLAASFFCTRTSSDCREAKRIIPTIAYQLARRFTPFRYSLCQQLKKDPDISTGQLSDQFDLLLKQPLLAAKDKLSNNLVIVVDALDECNDPHIVELFLNLLFRSVIELPVKFFVTSRPEPVIRNTMMLESERARSILYLHEIEKSLVQADIELYLRDELASISPVDEDISELAEHAGRLFIYAATAVRHIRPVGKAVNSKARLKAVLAVNNESATSLSAIDSLYTAILTDALYDQEFTREEQNQMRLVLHTAICACEPILIQTLSALFGMEDKDDTIAALQPLRSVLHVSERTELVTTLHASFPDFMFDRKRSGAFYCHKAEHSRFLSEVCFRIMNAQLRFNICSIPSSFIPNDQVPGLEDRVITNISEELSYTCRFWMDHLSATNPHVTLLPLVDTFMSQQLLFWMEVMSLKGSMVLGVIAMTKLNAWLTQLQQDAHKNLLTLASDAQAFVARYASSPASTFTSHIYLSALPFTPSSSAVRSRYLPQFKGLIKVTGTRFNKIVKASLGIWASEHSVHSTAVSPDGNRIVLGDDKGNISVRNAYDGKYIVQPFKAHRKMVTTLGISIDGMHIVSGSHDMTLSVWSIYDGTLTAGPFKGHKGYINSVAFSPDAAHIVSGSKDCVIGVWDSHNAAAAMRSFVGHEKEVKAVAFSLDGSRVVSGSADHTIRVWDVSSGTSIHTLYGHTLAVSSVMFSPCGTRIISGSYDHSICRWNTSDGTLLRKPLTRHPGQITSLALSPDGNRIVSGSRDFKVRVWDMHSGELVAGPFQGHAKMIRSVSFLGGGGRVISTSEDTVRVWTTHAPALSTKKASKGRVSDYGGIVSSPSQTHVALRFGHGLEDNSKIQVWDLRTTTHIVISTGAEIKHLQFSPDGSRIHTLHAPGTLCTWDTQTANPLNASHNRSTLESWDSATCSADGTRVVFCHRHKATLWHVQSNGSMVLCEIKDDSEGYLVGAIFSPDGSRFVTSRYLWAMEVWDAEDGARVAGPFVGVAVGLSIDRKYLCCWSPKHYGLINIITGEETPIRCLQFLKQFVSDGLHVAGQDGRFIHMWNMLGQVVCSVEIPSAASGLRDFIILQCSSDGRLLLSYYGTYNKEYVICRTHFDSPPFTPNPDGWILNHQKQPLFWVPTEVREDFPGCNGAIIADCKNPLLNVDYDGMLVGDDWNQCYVPT